MEIPRATKLISLSLLHFTLFSSRRLIFRVVLIEVASKASWADWNLMKMKGIRDVYLNSQDVSLSGQLMEGAAVHLSRERQFIRLFRRAAPPPCYCRRLKGTRWLGQDQAVETWMEAFADAYHHEY